VVLTGHVHSEGERKKALSLTKKVKGVRRVTDELQVMHYRKYQEM
jgi:osmotically-inducible protein OsmY